MYGNYYECDWCGNKAFLPNTGSYPRMEGLPDGWKYVSVDRAPGEEHAPPAKHMCKDCAEERLK